VFIYRQAPGSTKQEIIKVDVSAIKKNEAPDPLLQAYDVVEVKEAGILSKKRIGETVINALTGGFSQAVSSTGMYLPNRVIY
jgi:hypothetical protein